MNFYRSVLSRTLANGVGIHVFPQPGSAVEVECFIRTGSIHEGEQLGCGLSHFLEHMVFQGSRGYPGTTAADTINRIGGQMNAYTSFDHTAYHAQLSGRHLKTAIEVIAAMVCHPEFPEERFASEREVILRERELSFDQPERRLFEETNRTVFRHHPVRHPIIGYRELIAGVTRDTIAAYHRRRYTPGRCFWVIVGDVDPEQAFALVTEQMEEWPIAFLEEPVLPQEPEQCAERRSGFIFADPLARLSATVRIPEITGADIPALDVLAGILGMGDGSRLVRILEQEKQLAVTLRSFCYSQPCGGLLGISAAATPGKLRKLESELRRELDRIRKGGLTRAEVSREKTQQLSEHLRELRGIREIAANIGGGVIAADAPDFSDTYLRRLSGLTPDDVTAAAEKYLTPERFSFVIQTPAKSGKRPGAVRFRKRPEPELVESAGLPRLVHLPDRRLPLVDFALVLPGGSIFEAPELGGISGLTADLLTAGTRKYSESEIYRRLDASGANLSVNAGANSLMVELTAPRRHFPAAFRLLAEILSGPTFPAQQFAREKNNRLELLASRALSPRAAAEDLARRLLFRRHPYSWGSTGTVEQLENITAETVREFYASRWNRSQTIAGFAGDCTRDEAETLLAELAGKIRWQAARCELPAPPVFPPEHDGFSSIELPREQTAVFCVLPGPALAGTELALFEIVLQAENGLSSPLFKAIREDNALAYTTGMRLAGGFHPGWLAFYAVTTADQVEKAAGLLLAEIRRLKETGLTEAEFEAAREGAAFAAARNAESVNGALSSTLLDLHYHRPFSECGRHEELLRSLDRTQVNAALRHFLGGVVVQVRAGRLKP